jgi:hypothetical protein
MKPYYDLDAEKAILGSCLLDPDAILLAREIVSVADFYLDRHSHIYAAMLDCLDDHQPPDLITVKAKLEERGQLDDCGGLSGLSELADAVPTAVHVEHYAKIVAQHATRRRIQDLGMELQSAASRNSDPIALLKEFQQRIDVERQITSGSQRWRESSADGADIWRKKYAQPPWIIEDILPAGTTIIHGPPKSKKTWTALGMAYAVAQGGYSLGQFKALRGEALYINLEMAEDLVHERLKVMFPTEAPPKGVIFAHSWPRVGQGFEEELDSYLKHRPYTRLIVIDTLVRVRPADRRRSGQVYEEDASFLQPITDFCEGRGVAVLIVHHSRKGASRGAVEGASGSHGLTGSVDNVMALSLDEKTKARAKLEVAGRRIRRDDEIHLRWDATLGQWSMIDKPAAISDERMEVLDILRATSYGVGAADIASALGRDRQSTTRLLSDMLRAGQVTNAQGLWFAAEDSQ